MVRAQPTRGEIWLVDLGFAQKTRPVVVLSVAYLEPERALITYVARTTSLRGTRFEVRHSAHGFKPGAFDAQSIGTIPVAKFIRKIAVLEVNALSEVEAAVRKWLQL